MPLIVICWPGVTLAPFAGTVITDDGAAVSEDAVAATTPDWIVDGCAPMSANRFTVACCMRASAARLPRSWFASSPHAHWTVPEPNTRAPLAAR